MIATNTNPEIQLNNGTFIKNPFVRDRKSTNDPINQTCVISFEMCVNVEENGQSVTKVIDTFTLSFTRHEEEAIILIDGEQVPLIQHLMSGGAFVEEDWIVLGNPPHNELFQWFDYGFGQVEFAESPLQWLAKLWGLKKIQFDGRTMQELGFEWQ